VELRRALLLFAIVLGLAAIATSFSRPAKPTDEPASEDPPTGRSTPTAGPRRTGPRPDVITFSAAGAPRMKRLDANRAAEITVEVPQPAQVELVGLGLTAAGEPLTPARFELLVRRPGRYDVKVTPSGDGQARSAGTLEVVADDALAAEP
jgi:hypothetical protein